MNKCCGIKGCIDFIPTTQVKNTFMDFLNVICRVCLKSIIWKESTQQTKEQSKKVYFIVKPILVEKNEVEYPMNVFSKDGIRYCYIKNIQMN